MFEPMMVLGLFGGLVWMVSQAIFMLLRGNGNVEAPIRRGDTMTSFVEENYGVRFVSANPLGEAGMRRL